jgi:hypothetical protein
MTTYELNQTLIESYLVQARESAVEGDQEEVCHFIRCVMLRAGLEQTEAYLTLTTREAQLASLRRRNRG